MSKQFVDASIATIDMFNRLAAPDCDTFLAMQHIYRALLLGLPYGQAL